jgi:transposase
LENVNIKRQCKGGGIMVWGMITPNGLLAIKILQGKIKSSDYLNMLQTFAVKLMKLNMQRKFSFVQDNCRIHKTKEVLGYLESQTITLIEWPPRSPDLNIMENVWKLMSDIVYGEGQPKNLKDLQKRIIETTSIINNKRRNTIQNLYSSFRHRLTYVLKNNGCMYK